MKSKTSAALLLVLIFLLGGVTGGVGHYLYRSHVSAASTQPNQPGHRYSPGEIAQEMAQALQLDEKQRESLQMIFKQSRERYRALSTQFHTQYETIRSETHEQIRQILREDQKPRFETFLKNMEKRRREHQTQSR